MRRIIHLEPNERYDFDVGKRTEVLIIRDSSGVVTLRGDIIAPLALSRSDIVSMIKYQNEAMYFVNERNISVTVEFQLSDTPISIREQRMSVEGGVIVDEILSPVTVDRILEPISIKDMPPMKRSTQKAAKLPELVLGSDGGVISANPNRLELLIVANSENAEVVVVHGIPLMPSQAMGLDAWNAINVTGSQGDKLHLMEITR